MYNLTAALEEEQGDALRDVLPAGGQASVQPTVRRKAPLGGTKHTIVLQLSYAEKNSVVILLCTFLL